ncbi:MAG TPA: hypothetical protein VF791_18355 [Pyrinomonadaceae bacterium]
MRKALSLCCIALIVLSGVARPAQAQDDFQLTLPPNATPQQAIEYYQAEIKKCYEYIDEMWLVMNKARILGARVKFEPTKSFRWREYENAARQIRITCDEIQKLHDEIAVEMSLLPKPTPTPTPDPPVTPPTNPQPADPKKKKAKPRKTHRQELRQAKEIVERFVKELDDEVKKLKSVKPPPGFKAESYVKGDLFKTTITTPEGQIIAYLPADMRPGETITGTVITEPNGATKEERDKNLKALSNYQLMIANQRAGSPWGAFTWKWEPTPDEKASQELIERLLNSGGPGDDTINTNGNESGASPDSEEGEEDEDTPPIQVGPIQFGPSMIAWLKKRSTKPPQTPPTDTTPSPTPPTSPVRTPPQTPPDEEEYEIVHMTGYVNIGYPLIIRRPKKRSTETPPPPETPPQTPGPFELQDDINQTGGVIKIKGPFNGNSSDTEINVRPAPGGKVQDSEKSAENVSGTIGPIKPLAESPRGSVFESPVNVTGPIEVTVKEGGVETKLTYRNVGVRLSAPKTSLQRGERTTLTIEVSGLEGIKQDLPLQLDAMGVIQMERGNLQNLWIRPQDVKGGRYTTTRAITGQQAGAFSVTATVINPARAPNRIPLRENAEVNSFRVKKEGDWFVFNIENVKDPLKGEPVDGEVILVHRCPQLSQLPFVKKLSLSNGGAETRSLCVMVTPEIVRLEEGGN